MTPPQSRIGPPSPQILETELAEEISLYDPTKEQVVVLNQTASDIWRLSDGELEMEEIVRLLAAAYGVDEDQIRGEVEETIRGFLDLGFLRKEQD